MCHVITMFRKKDAEFLDTEPIRDTVEDIPVYKRMDDTRLGGSYSLDAWIDLMRPHQLRVQDLDGGTIDLLLLCRNVVDLAEWNEGNPPSNPELFFKNNYRILYTPRQDNLLEGTARWDGDTMRQPFRFHLDLGTYWYPTGEEGDVLRMWGNLHGGRRSKPGDRIGWRGPCIPWNLLSHCPTIFY